MVHSFRVAGIAEDALLTGKVDFTDPEGIVIRLDDAQRIFDLEGRLSSIGVTMAGGIEGGAESSDAVDAKLNDFLRREQPQLEADRVPVDECIYSVLGSNGFRPRSQSDPFKQDTVDDAELFGSIFTSLFLVMGTFSVAAGILLIFLIFAMLAEERRWGWHARWGCAAHAWWKCSSRRGSPTTAVRR